MTKILCQFFLDFFLSPAPSSLFLLSSFSLFFSFFLLFSPQTHFHFSYSVFLFLFFFNPLLFLPFFILLLGIALPLLPTISFSFSTLFLLPLLPHFFHHHFTFPLKKSAFFALFLPGNFISFYFFFLPTESDY